MEQKSELSKQIHQLFMIIHIASFLSTLLIIIKSKINVIEGNEEMYFDDEYILKTVIQHIQDKEEEYDVCTWKDANKELTDNNGDMKTQTSTEEQENTMCFTSNMVKYKYPLGYVKIIRLDGELGEQIVESVSLIIKSLNTCSINSQTILTMSSRGADLK